MVELDAPDGQYRGWSTTRNGSPASFAAPDLPGEYELRYVLGGQSTVLTRQAIELTEIAASLSGPAEIAAGSAFEVDGTGPGNQSDYLTIVETGAADGHYLSYSYATSGTPATLLAPEQAGSYELRYITGYAHRVLAQLAVMVLD